MWKHAARAVGDLEGRRRGLTSEHAGHFLESRGDGPVFERCRDSAGGYRQHDGSQPQGISLQRGVLRWYVNDVLTNDRRCLTNRNASVILIPIQSDPSWTMEMPRRNSSRLQFEQQAVNKLMSKLKYPVDYRAIKEKKKKKPSERA